MLDWRITSHHPSDTLGTCIRYCSADLYNTYTMYHPPDVCWHVLNDTMSQYYLCHHRIFGLNALKELLERHWSAVHSFAQHSEATTQVGSHCRGSIVSVTILQSHSINILYY